MSRANARKAPTPADAIIEVCAVEAVDLIMICTDGRDNLKDFVSGTITEKVINDAPCPVLVITHRNYKDDVVIPQNSG